MAEAADQGIRKLLYHCQTPRAIPMLVHTLKTDKNARIRSSCASYLAQAMETWDVGALGVRADELESGMKTAAQDASAEARQAARALFAGYAQRMPDHASAFLRRLEPWLADKLQAKSGAEQQRKPSAAHAKPFHSFSRPQSAASNPKDEIIIMAPPVPRAATFTPHASTAHPPPQLNHSMTSGHPPGLLGSAAKPRPATAGARPMGLGPARVEQSSGPQELVGGSGGPYLAQGIEPPPKPMTSKARRSSVQAYAANLSHTPAQRVLTTPLPPSRPADAYGAGGPVPYAGNAPASVLPAHRPASSPASSSHHSNSSSVAGGLDAAVPDGSARPSGIGRSSYSGSSHDHHRQPLHTPQQPHQQQQQHARVTMSVPKVTAALLAGPKLWSEKGPLVVVWFARSCVSMKSGESGNQTLELQL
ncbi:hypothetical protein DUNSADRAFT_16883 [Dunaliella salina]|uniref:CLASP N-terminal domain-containing protein n=1 Tax=Dunaliella salina TaxID=3046 RepID=A0ABQ7H952_DUNSA|nr:hypothetical protein DUNSADRAFT_16883 [Dunaliella salina]|eukprot:KAF5843384.1 hypothetical protein DUNSADRAFT_16883 [Dunaliella salina]